MRHCRQLAVGVKPRAWRWLVLLALLLGGCAHMAPVLPSTPPSVARFTSNQVAVLVSGRDALAARLDLIEHARRRIDFQYYLFHADDSGRLVAQALLRAADRGVQVRGLIDDMHGVDNQLLKALNAHPNIEIRRYNPFRWSALHLLELTLNYDRVGRRMHNKQLTVDGAVSIVGGRNIGDEYFGRGVDLSFTDLDVLVSGPAVGELELIFEDYWRARYSRPRGPAVDPGRVRALREQLASWSEAPPPAAIIDPDRAAYAQARASGRLPEQACPTLVLSDQPEKLTSPRPTSEVARQLAQSLRESRDDVLLVSAYFVPGDAGADTLAKAARRRVRVQVVTNSLASTDVPAVHAGYRHYREPLLRAGVQLWETKPVLTPRHRRRERDASSRASLHTKAYFFDRRYLFVGSFNLDPRSVALNTEMGLLFDCPALAGPLRESVGRTLPELAYRVYLNDDEKLRWVEEGKGGHGKIFEREPRASLWRRFQVWWLQWLPIESEL